VQAQVLREQQRAQDEIKQQEQEVVLLKFREMERRKLELEENHTSKGTAVTAPTATVPAERAELRRIVLYLHGATTRRDRGALRAQDVFATCALLVTRSNTVDTDVLSAGQKLPLRTVFTNE